MTFDFWESATYNGKSLDVSANTATTLFTVTVFVGVTVQATEEIREVRCYPVIN
jgi:hypothetical protein